MQNVIACILTAAISLPVSFLVARTCLRGLVRVITGSDKRSVL